jgi:hypothetical protein
MGIRNLPSFQLNWSSSLNSGPGGVNPSQAVNLSGTVIGAMASTNVIYSNVQTIGQSQNIGLEITWTGTPTGTLQVLVSNSGINFYPLTFNPALTQPAGAGGGYVTSLNQLPFTYYALQYTNSSGSGSLYIYVSQKDLGS